MEKNGYRGTGPGAMTPDGNAVELYLRLPAGGEADIVAAAVPPGARILELGSGVGRVTHPLLERGFTVVAVDESPEMLAHVRGARTVCASIVGLDLGETFDVVMLGSFLVNAGGAESTREMLRACARHLAAGGCVIVEGEGEQDFFADVPRTWDDPRGFTTRIVSAEPVGGGVRRITIEYDFPDAAWSRAFLTRRMSRDEYEAALAGAGLRVDRYLTPDRVWSRVVASR